MVVSEGGGYEKSIPLSPEAMKIIGTYIPTPERVRHFPGSAPAVVQSFAERCEALASEKDALYGGAWQRQGYMGNMARVLSKVERLRNMVWRDGEGEGTPEETIQDTLRDLANLCAFMAHNIEEDNRWGRQ